MLKVLRFAVGSTVQNVVKPLAHIGRGERALALPRCGGRRFECRRRERDGNRQAERDGIDRREFLARRGNRQLPFLARRRPGRSWLRRNGMRFVGRSRIATVRAGLDRLRNLGFRIAGRMQHRADRTAAQPRAGRVGDCRNDGQNESHAISPGLPTQYIVSLTQPLQIFHPK